MTSFLFSAWISHFIASIRRQSVISPEERHLLILDGHNSHVTLEVARNTRDYWSSRNINQAEVMAQWVSLGLRKALSVANIRSGFKCTGIFPLNPRAVDLLLTPSEVYRPVGGGDSAEPARTHLAKCTAKQDGHESVEEAQGGRLEDEGDGLSIQQTNVSGSNNPSNEHDISADFNREPDAATEHYFVDMDPSYDAVEDEIATVDLEVAERESITRFLQLPSYTPRASSRRREPIVDFAKSVILTSSEFEDAAIGLVKARKEAAKEKERQK
ncbi:hypothetical protein M758_UG192600 [Ceratodon purpureus]|nr:hypothetical protein M758_UG192600 [Ceratodon purpureus]